jgi:calcineurin-like phosphoesterase family protein
VAHTHIISDLHIGHTNILKYRSQFPDIEDHDATILENILGATGKRDSLWLLGDCFFDENSIEFLRTISKNVMYVNWVMGNHDTDNAARQKVLRQIIAEGLVYRVGSMFMRGGFWYTHHPVHPLELRGKFNIHGHVHSATLPDSRYFNVSCENVDYTPIKLATLKEMFYGEGGNSYVAPDLEEYLGAHGT